MSRYYDKHGEPISLLTWAQLLEDRAYAQVAYDEVGLTVKVSTVWLGLDHNWGGGRPVIFETMVFTFLNEPYTMPSGSEHWWEGVEQYRYHTLAEALQGHAQILAMVQVLEGVR